MRKDAVLDDARFTPPGNLPTQARCTKSGAQSCLGRRRSAPAHLRARRVFMLHAQVEAGSLCPITMTFAATPLLLQMLPAPFQDWTTPLLSDRDDSNLLPGGNAACLLAWE
ncbi:hypothetical protein ACNKHP_16725 [Shigella boydii]